MCFKVVWEGYYKIMALEFYLSHQISFSQHYLKLFLTFKLPHVLKSSCLEANKWKEGSLSREVVSDSSLKNEESSSLINGKITLKIRNQLYKGRLA